MSTEQPATGTGGIVPPNRNKVLIFGVDGATFKIIDRMVAEDRLPTLKRLMQEGVRSNLISTTPAVSPVAWTSFMTGKKPGKHNIFDFFGKIPNHYRFRINTSKDRKAKAIWNTLSDAGQAVNVVGVTMTFPPDEVNGFFVSGLGIPQESKTGFTYPSELSKEIHAALGPYLIIPENKHGMETISGKQDFLDGILGLIQYRKEMFQMLSAKRDFDFQMCFFIDTDGASHHFWRYLEDNDDPAGTPEERRRFGDAIDRVYAAVDASIAEVIAEQSENTNIIIMSDHGFGPLRRIFSISNWLEQQGYLYFHRQGIRSALGVFAKRALNKLQRKAGLGNEALLGSIDWERTRVYFYGTVGNLFINLRGRDPKGTVDIEEYDALRHELREKLKTVVDPQTGKSPISEILLREEAFPGPHESSAPDMVVTMRPGYGVFTGDPRKKASDDIGIFFNAYAWNGDHEAEGVFIGHGPDFQDNKQLAEAQILDIAPTVLYLMGHPIPEDFDGQVIPGAICEEKLKAEPIRSCPPDDDGPFNGDTVITRKEEATIQDQLRRLGYID